MFRADLRRPPADGGQVPPSVPELQSMADATPTTAAPPDWATAALVLGDGQTFWGRGIGAAGEAVGEVCFNTSITGYQEILTDPAYAGQIITFTFPHIGNVGANEEDLETTTPAARGLIIKTDITEPSNYRALQPLDDWLKSRQLSGIAGLDTRQLTRLVRDSGAPSGGDLPQPGAAVRHRRAAPARHGLAGPRGHGPGERGQLPAELWLGGDQLAPRQRLWPA